MRWFVGAHTNAAFNELDRHVLTGHGDETAFLSEPDDAMQLATSRRELLIDSALAIIGFGATSFFLWHSFLLHTLFMVWLTLVAVHNGSTYSFRNFAFRYAQKKLNEHPECAE